MLIEFSVTNFGAFRDRQTLSLVANKKEKDHEDALIPVDLPGFRDEALLRAAVFYGANASGKSTVVRAVHFAKSFIEESGQRGPSAEIGVTPFLLDAESKTRPSEFEFHFIHEQVRYQYGFSVDKKRVHAEWLYAYPAGRAQTWFTRDWDGETQEYDWYFGNNLKGDKEGIRDKTRPNVLFLSAAAHWDNEQLGRIWRWFDGCLRVIDCSFIDRLAGLFSYTTRKVHGGQGLKGRIASLLKAADDTVVDAGTRVYAEEDILKLLEHETFPEQDKEELLKLANDDSVILPFLKHTEEHGEASRIAFADESSGTRKFFALLGPMLDAREKGYTLVVDELGANMHSLLVRGILKLFRKPQQDDGGAQLVFTTHDTSLLDTSLLRRDQVWFTERDAEGGAALYPVSDFRPRKNESLEKGYLQGRYGAIPLLTGNLEF